CARRRWGRWDVW
nr:immunoglobulin heavy chain junction region [Macaca mulatta]